MQEVPGSSPGAIIRCFAPVRCALRAHPPMGVAPAERGLRVQRVQSVATRGGCVFGRLSGSSTLVLGEDAYGCFF